MSDGDAIELGMEYMMIQAAQIDKIRMLERELADKTITAERFALRTVEILNQPLPARLQKYVEDSAK